MMRKALNFIQQKQNQSTLPEDISSTLALLGSEELDLPDRVILIQVELGHILQVQQLFKYLGPNGEKSRGQACQ